MFRVVGEGATEKEQERFWKSEAATINAAIKRKEGLLGQDDTKKDLTNNSPPVLPKPGPGPTITETNARVDYDPHRPPERPASKRSETLLDELREAARDFLGAFDPKDNAHRKVRDQAERYLKQLELENPDVTVIFGLGVRLGNAVFADLERQKMIDSIDREPEFTQTQREALKSSVDLHAIYIATDPDGVELIEAAERDPFMAQEVAPLKKQLAAVVDDLDRARNLARDRLLEFNRGSVEEMGSGPNPARGVPIAKNTVQRTIIFLAQAALGAFVGKVALGTGLGQEAVQIATPLADKAIRFFLENAETLRLLAASAREGFGFLGPLIDYIKRKTGRA